MSKGKRTNHLPNPDLFSREKTITANKQVKQVPADWRKFVIGATPVVLVKGMGVTETEYRLIINQGEDAVKYFLGEKALKSFLEENKVKSTLTDKK